MKYIFFDIDSTLMSHVGRPHIPGETKEAIKLLKLKGHVPAIATGRGGFLSQLVADELEIECLVCSGGAEIFYKDQKILNRYLPEDILREFLDIAKRFPEVAAAADEKFLYTDGFFQDLRKYFNSQAGYDCIKSLREIKRAIICYIMLSPDLINSEYGFFYKGNINENIKLEPMKRFIEARPANTTKWNGIEFFINHIGADIRDVITFGDGPNDVEMLKNAPLGVAVKRSSEEVRGVADFITEDIDEGGILKACYDLNLI